MAENPNANGQIRKVDNVGRSTLAIPEIIHTKPEEPVELSPIPSTPAAIRPLRENWFEAYTVEYVRPLFPDRGNHPNLYLTAEVFTLILNYLANTGVYYKACVAAGLSTRYVLKMRKQYPVLEELIQDALELYRAKLSDAIHTRAVDGWEEDVYFQGVLCGSVRRYSDRLLELMAKRHMPEFRDHTTTDVNVTGGVLVVHAPAQDREAWLAEHRKKDAIEGEVVK